jgi:hypothetical protein
MHHTTNRYHPLGICRCTGQWRAQTDRCTQLQVYIYIYTQSYVDHGGLRSPSDFMPGGRAGRAIYIMHRSFKHCVHRRGVAASEDGGDRDGGGGGRSSRRWRWWCWRWGDNGTSASSMWRHGWDLQLSFGGLCAACYGDYFRCSLPLCASSNNCSTGGSTVTSSTHSPEVCLHVTQLHRLLICLLFLLLSHG